MKKTVKIILAKFNGQRAIHFRETLLSGRNNNLWFPIGDQDLLRATADIMTFNDLADRVSCVQQIMTDCEKSTDWLVTYHIKDKVMDNTNDD